MARLLHPPIPGFPQELYVLVLSPPKSAVNAVLKLISAVIAIAHILSVNIKSISVSISLSEYSLGKLNKDSSTLPMSGSYGLHLFLPLKHLFFLQILINNL